MAEDMSRTIACRVAPRSEVTARGQRRQVATALHKPPTCAPVKQKPDARTCVSGDQLGRVDSNHRPPDWEV